MFRLPRPVWMLGWVSFFTDTASEMIYPLLPLFLTRVLGAGAMSLGVIEEGVEKAWVADLAPAHGRGNAFGIYDAVIGIGALTASLLFGFVWTHVSPPAAFCTGAAFAMAATALLYLMFSSEPRPAR